MHVRPLRVIDNTPSLAAMIGSVGSQDVIDQINARWGGASTVAFGQANNPMNTGYMQFLNLIQGQIARTDNLVQQIVQSIIYPETWRTIDSEEALAMPPPSMQMALLMTPPVLELFKNHQISGWGWDPDTFPDRDMYERSLNNGKVETRPDPNDVPDEVVTEWRTDETEYDLDDDNDYQNLVQSRKYITNLLKQELGPEGQRRDITDLTQTMSV